MDYNEMARELLNIRAILRHVPADQQISNLARGELFVLNYLLFHEGKAFPKDLSREMVVSTARIAVLLNRMDAKGKVKRLTDTNDNRQIIVSLTHAGQLEAENNRDKVVKEIIQMLEYLGPEDAKNFLRIQKRILRAFGRQS